MKKNNKHCCNWLNSCYKFPVTVEAAIQSLRPLTTDVLLNLIKHRVASYLFINSLSDVSQSAPRVVVGIIGGSASERLAPSSMPSPSDPFGHVKMLPSVHMGVALLPERLFTFSFNMNHSY